MSDPFQRLSEEYAAGGIAAVLVAAEAELRVENRYHELFEVLKMSSRHALGLPLLHQGEQALPEIQRRALEDGLLEACRDVGFALLRAGQIQDSWVYLRHLDDHENVLNEVRRIDVTEDNLDQVLGLLLHEGLDTESGYALVLEHHGTCNAITTMQQAMYGRSKQERQSAGRLLVAHVHQELLENVKSHIQREEHQLPTESRLGDVIANRAFLFADGAYHIDTSHLSSTVQIAGELVDAPSLELALDMSRYGQRLDAGLQYPGDPPFEDLYPTYARFFSAQLGQEAEAAVAYFRKRAEASDAHQEGTFAIEAYIDLLSRIGEPAAAIEATVDFIPAGIQTSGRAPSLYDLSEQLGDFCRYRELCSERNDMLGYVVSLER